MFIVHFLLVLTSAFSVFAAGTDCNPFLASKAGTKLDVATLDKMSDLLELSDSERDNVRSYATFFTEALQARAKNSPLEKMQSPYLTEQSRRLQGTLQVFIENWRGFQDAIQKALDRRISSRQNAIDAMEETLRSGKSADLVERKKQEIIGTLNRVSQKYRGEDANLEDFSHAIEVLSANPEREFFELKQNFGKFKEKIAADKATAQQNSDLALVMLKQISSLLAQAGETIDYQTLVQLELAAAVIDEAGDRRFINLPDPKDHDDEGTFASSYGITFDGVAKDLQAWSSGQTKQMGRDVYDMIERWSQQFAKRGVVRLPIIGPVSQRESLAIAFMPIQPLRYQLEETWVSDFEEKPHRGHTVTWWDMSGGGDTGYNLEAFTKGDSKAWIAALNSSFNNWYLLLGGTPDSQGTPLKRADPGGEAVVRALLYFGRYLPDIEHEAPEWTSAESLAKLFFAEFAGWDEPHLFNPNLMDFFAGKGPAYFGELGVPKKIGEPQITEAMDHLIARLLRNPDLKVTDANLRRLFERFPTTAFSAKMLVLKAIEGDPKPERRSGGPGGSMIL